MTFLQPWAVWFLAGIPVIVALYMLRLKRQEITVSTHLFWQRVLQESSRRAFFHRIRHLLSLLLQILIFLLIAAALSRPFWKHDAEVSTNTVLVIDTRARMQAIESDGESRFVKAIAAAGEYIRQANARSATDSQKSGPPVPPAISRRESTSRKRFLPESPAAGESSC